MKVLLIEDEKGLSDSIIKFLKLNGYVCELAETFRDANEKTGLYRYDCILVDINLPDGSGLNIIRKLKESKQAVGIIIISARDNIDDRIKGLELGADDYLVKPFDLLELNARIKSLIRRISFSGSNEIIAGELKILPDEFKVSHDNELIDLTRKEYNLLVFLVANPNRVLAKETIAEHLWGDDMDMADSYDFVYSHVKNLRKKLNDRGLGDYIQTIYGIGYKFTPDKSDS
jgi:DNA-binding response OmpR family regulator